MRYSKDNTKIFFVNKFKWLDAAPMATISTFFTHALAELGYETNLIIQGEGLIDTNDILKKRFGLSPLSNYKIKLFSRFHSSFLKTSSNFYWKTVRNILANRKSDKKIIVISRNTNFLPYMVMLKKMFNMTAIFETHGYHGYLTLPGFPPPPHRPFLKLSYQSQRTEKIFLNHIDGLVCITSPQKKLYLNDFVKIPTILLTLGSPKSIGEKMKVDSKTAFSHKKVCYIGRLNQHINYKMIINAFKLLKDKSIKFVWIGLKKENFKILENEIKNQSLDGQVELKGWMNHNEMQKYLVENISAGLVAYKPTYQSMVFTSPSKIFDYFAIGLPVIAPRLPNVEDVIVEDNNGLLYESENSMSLAKKISLLFENYQIYQELQNASRKSAEEFSWKNRAEYFISFVENLN